MSALDARRFLTPWFWLPITVAVAILALHLATLREGHDWGGDFALYIAHAKNLVAGTAYADTGYLYSQLNPFVSPPTYPPGFPLMLVPVMAWVGLDFVALKVVCVVAFVTALVVGCAALRGHLHRADRVIWMLLLGLNPYFWNFRNSVLSDLPFLLFVLASLAVIGTAEARDPSVGGVFRRPWWHGVGCGLLMGSAMATRTVGILLPASLILTGMLRRGPDRRFAVLACAVGMVLLLVQNLLVHRDAAYLDQLLPYLATPAALIDTMHFTLASWAIGWMAMWSSGHGESLSACVAVLMLLTAAGGFVLHVRVRGWSIFEIFTLFYVAAVVVWPMAQDPRFLIPVMPLLTAYSLVALRAIAVSSLPLRVRRRCLAVLPLCLVLHVGFGTLAVAQARPRPGITAADATRLFQFLRSATEPGDIMLSAKPRVVALMTGRRCGALVAPSDFQRHVVAMGATHLVLVGLPEERRWKAERIVEANRSRLRQVYRDGHHRVYRIR